MNSSKGQLSIVNALNSLSSGELDILLGEKGVEPCFGIDGARRERISSRVRQRLGIKEEMSLEYPVKRPRKLLVRRLAYSLAAVVALTLICTLSLVAVLSMSRKGASENNMPSMPGDSSLEDNVGLFYDTFENYTLLEAYLKAEGRSTPWGEYFSSKGEILLLTTLAPKEDCRFGLYYNCIEVITDNESIGNGYVIYLLESKHSDIIEGCLEAGIDIRKNHAEGEYSIGQVAVNNSLCPAVKTVSEDNSGYIYYVLYGNYLYVINAHSDDVVANLQAQ